MNERGRWLELLPFYLNGTLSDADRVWVEQYMALYPQLRSQLDFQRAVRDNVIETVEQSVRDVSDSIGLPRTLSMMHAPPSRWSVFSRWPPGWRLTPALAVALFVIGVQGVLLVQIQHKEISPVRSVGRSLADGPLLRVNFKPQAREAQIRLLMIEAHALIVAGPTRLGDYYLKASSERLPATRTLLEHSALVQQVDEVRGLPEELLE